ncbi:unnamed protein product [Echinostoma caproni]|uniref:P-loop containing nucleoside triphosphate hydrolase protein n=1 Tax=Echinostoma caproni TaxID=27848 RepID=A0A183ADB1_9TREM|nr:unnamed protein product [Echinostoma caproni]
MSHPRTDTSLLVIGAGCGRTGTASLKQALEILFHRPCYHMHTIMEKHPDHPQKWVELDNQVTESMRPGGKPVDARLIQDLLHDYCGAVDFPAASYYWQIMQVYPDAKVILTVRDTNKWVESARATIIPANGRPKPPWFVRWVWFLRVGRSPGEMPNRFFNRTFGGDVFQMDDEQLGRAFDQWNADVQRKVPKERLLVYRVQDGWEPLCKFLQMDVPNQPFPCVNERDQFGRHVRFAHALNFALGIGIPLGVTILAVGLGLYAWRGRR